jgi:MoaA/NifB/PqqE/SkfB family radical SAM enzyme
MCNIWKIYEKNPQKAGKELHIEEIEKIFDDRIFSKVREVMLTGGEPTLRNDLIDIVNILHNKMPKSSFTISINGLTDRAVKIAEEITDLNIPLYVSLSLDGFSGTRNTIRGVPYAYDRALKTLEKLLELRNHAENFHLGVSCVIVSENLENVYELLKFVTSKKVDFSWKLPQVSETLYHNKDSAFNYNPSKLKEILLRLINETDLYPEKFYHEGILSLLYGICENDYLVPCESGSYSFYLDPYGNLYPCVFWNECLGNLKTSRFEDLWNSELANKIRIDAYQRKCPNCWNGCELWQSLELHPYKWIKWYLKSKLLGKRKFLI